MNKSRIARISRSSGYSIEAVRDILAAAEATPRLSPGAIARAYDGADMAVLSIDGKWHRMPNTTFLTETMVQNDPARAIVDADNYTVVYDPDGFDWAGAEKVQDFQ